VGSAGEAALSAHEKLNLACKSIQIALYNLIEYVEAAYYNIVRPNSGEAQIKGRGAQSVQGGIGGASRGPNLGNVGGNDVDVYGMEGRNSSVGEKEVAREAMLRPWETKTMQSASPTSRAGEVNVELVDSKKGPQTSLINLAYEEDEHVRAGAGLATGSKPDGI